MSECPKVIPRRLYDEDDPNGYLESSNDYIANNMKAVLWFLDNASQPKKQDQSAEGMEGHLVMNFETDKHVFRVYHEDKSFTDYDLHAESIKVKILEKRVRLREDNKSVDWVERSET